MRLLIFIVLNLALAGLSFAQPAEKCFKNLGLKDEHRINFTISGRDVKGDLIVIREYDEPRAETYPFTGTASKANISVSFPDGKIPDVFPKKGSRMALSFATIGDAESLTVKLSSLIHDRGWFDVYSATYESCEPSYSKLAGAAKRVAFAKGKSSATAAVIFTTRNDRQSFLLGLRQGQKLTVRAIGCGISFFYPDKKKYEEGTAIDTWGSESLPQSGDYLFLILPAGEPGTCSVIFKTN